jgi:putative ABC transport system permease protein
MRFTTRMFLRSLLVRRSRAITALLAVTVAATVATALLNLYTDTQSKLTREFRAYGANATVSGDSVHLSDLRLKPDERAVALSYVSATDQNGRPVIVAGTDVLALRRLNGFWKTSGDADTLVGGKVYARGGWQTLQFGTSQVMLANAASLTTGDADESRIFIPIEKLRTVSADVKTQVVLLSIPGDAARVNSRITELRSEFPQYRVEPVRQIVETQASVLLRMRSVLLLSTALIAAIAALSLLASLSASVLERRKDFAVLKALGASRREVNGIFLLEGLALSLVGCAVGFTLGCLVSALIGYLNFHSAVRPRFEVLPWIVLGAIVITLIGALLPLQGLQKIQPAAMLKGE